MPKINILDSSIYNLIAAGEVVERPASVIKELVENSLDAGATQISVEIESGGIKAIKVSDDGFGIDNEDLHKVFLPHSTSKITTAEDLNSIMTLGFRGEALASISAVSNCKVSSRIAGAELGFAISCDNGVLGEVEPIGMAYGTVVSVIGLFAKVPARAKFLKKPAQEESAVSNLMMRIILSRPDVAFKYISDGQTKYLTQGKGITDALICVYGKNILNQIIYVNGSMDGMVVDGYVSKPSHSKANRTHQTLMVNGRYVINTTVSAAVHKACDEGLMKRQYPLYVLNLTIPHDKVDINVHPNKLDVRFLDSSAVFSLIFNAVKISQDNDIKQEYLTELKSQSNFLSSLKDSQEDICQKAELPNDRSENKSMNEGFSHVVYHTEDAQNSQPNPELNSRLKSNELDSSVQDGFRTLSSYERLIKSSDSDSVVGTDVAGVHEDGGKMYSIMQRLSRMKQENAIPAAMGIESNGANETQFEKDSPGEALFTHTSHAKSPYDSSSKELLSDETILPHLASSVDYVHVGTLFDTYLIIQRKNSVLFLDQHAAHERLIFDKLMSDAKGNDEHIQDLLIPYVFDVNHLEFSALAELLPILNDLGFGVEEFGGLSYRINHVPAVLSNINLKDFVNTILSESVTLGKITAEDLLKERLAMSACKSAVKAGDQLNSGEVDALLRQLDDKKTTPLCPHGRPIVIAYSKSDIEKWFKRIV